MELTDEDRKAIALEVKRLLTSKNPGFVRRDLCDERHYNLKEAIAFAQKMIKGLYVFIGLVFIEVTAVILLTLLGAL